MDIPDRNAEIVEEHLRGTSQVDSAKRFGVSRERIRQLLRRAGVPTDLSAALRRLSHSKTIRCEICGQPRFVEHASRAGKTCGRGPCLRGVVGPPEKYEGEELLQHLRDLAASLGYTPRQKDINRVGPPVHTTYFRYFGSLRAAQAAAGLKPNAHGGWQRAESR